jgi:phage gp29-like protein
MQLVDQFGRPISSKDARKPETRPLAVTSVRDRWSEYPADGLTPGRLARIFKQADQGDVSRQAELFEAMEERDAHLFSQLQIRKLAVQGLPWEILPAGEDARARRAADLCREVLAGLDDFDEHVLDLLDAVGKGYSLMQIRWDASSGQAWPTALEWIHPKKLTWFDSLAPRVLTETDPVRGVDPAPWSCVYHCYKARSGYDTRAGVLRVCAWMYLFKSYNVKDWVSFCETYGTPLRLGKYAPGASEAEKDSLMQAVRSLGADAAGIISKSTEIEFVQAAQKASSDVYAQFVRWCDAQESKAILGQVLTSEASGEQGSGSYALGRVHGDVRQDLVEADCTALGKTVSRQLLRPIVGFNLGWDAPTPTFRFDYEPPEDKAALAHTYHELADMGFDISQEHISARFRVPMRAKGETPLRPVQAEAQALKIALKGASPAAVETSPAGEALDILEAKTMEAAADPLGAWLDRVERLVAECADLEEVRDRLLELAGEELSASDLGAALARAFALADLAGRYDGKEGA